MTDGRGFDGRSFYTPLTALQPACYVARVSFLKHEGGLDTQEEEDEERAHTLRTPRLGNPPQTAHRRRPEEPPAEKRISFLGFLSFPPPLLGLGYCQSQPFAMGALATWALVKFFQFMMY